MHEHDPAAPRLLTARRIAEKLNQPIRRVLHVLDVRRETIRPAAYAARTRLYFREAIGQVRAALDSAKREVRS